MKKACNILPKCFQQLIFCYNLKKSNGRTDIQPIGSIYLALEYFSDSVQNHLQNISRCFVMKKNWKTIGE